jgi:fatty acid desaturase
MLGQLRQTILFGLVENARADSASNERPSMARTHATTREDIARLHEFEHWPARWMWPMIGATLALGGAAEIAFDDFWPLLLLIWPLAAAINFVLVLAFHDASHGRLHPVHRINEFYGHLMGTVMLTPLNVYRYAHARHHAQLGRPGDPELWPFNSPNVPRVLRVAAAFVEIVFGAVYTPMLFLRSVLVGQLTPRERAAILRGYAACAIFWTITIAVVSYFDLWVLLTVSLVMPMMLAGMMQTLNKFEQHLGLHGHTVLGLTRTVVDQSKASEMVSAAMLYNDYHGTHHRYAKIPYYHLPSATPYTLAGATEHCPVYPSIVSATLDMLRCLANPKVGPQWIEQSSGLNPGDSKQRSNGTVEQPVFTGAYRD